MKTANVIEISALKYSWASTDTPVLDISELSVPKGQRLFLKGPSGSGKSTLLNVLGAVIVPDEGQVRVLDQDLENMSQSRRDRFRADHIGFIFQQFNLIPYLSVIQNVCLGVRFSHRRSLQASASGLTIAMEAQRLLSALGLNDESLLRRRVTDLSVGQQQRVAAARALLGRPELVIADEPTSSLDMDNRKAFVELLENECTQSNATLVFVSHDPTLGDAFDRVLDLALINKVKNQ